MQTNLADFIRDTPQGQEADRILGHGEVTPSYKEDPGPTFPWRRQGPRHHR